MNDAASWKQMLALGARSIALCRVRALSAKKLVARARVATDLKTNGAWHGPASGVESPNLAARRGSPEPGSRRPAWSIPDTAATGA
jgi:hypothetical protein